MRKLFTILFLTTSLLYLTGCGGGPPYDDLESVYEPTISLNEQIVENANYSVMASEIIRKSHKDVGNIMEITFQYENKTDELLYLTASNIEVDGKELSVSMMAFFEEMTPNSKGTATAYFQDIKDNDWSFELPQNNVYMEVEVVDGEESEVIETHIMNVAF